MTPALTPPLTLAAALHEVRDLLATSQNLAAVEYAHAALRGVLNLEGEAAHLAYLYALASARAGAPGSAERMLERLATVNHTDAALAADIESLAGRLAKDAFIETGASLHLQTAITAYQRADRIFPSVHARINAASLLRLAGSRAEADALARQVQREIGLHRGATHWDAATVGEAALLLCHLDEACQHYRDAHRRAGRRFGDIASMRRQLQMLGGVLPEAFTALREIPGPTVLAFSGHMIDSPARPTPRFPACIEDAVRGAMDSVLDTLLPIIGYSQAACGGDLLFCEALLAREQEVNIVLPFSRDDFIAQSVVHAGASWVRRFERVLADAMTVTYATKERYLGDDSLFEHAANLIQGMAFLRAGELAVEPQMLVVSDRTQTGATGGTLATLGTWDAQQNSHIIIDLAAIRASAVAVPLASETGQPFPLQAPTIAAGRTIKSLLFADVKGSSRLPEEYFPLFFTTFLGLIPKSLRETAITPLEISSRGDGLYAVFGTPEEAAEFALTLSEAVGAVDWRAMGLPDDTHVRIALHAGPVFSALDPVTNTLAHYGTHVTRAARVEPIVVPGQVLVTEAFAALLAARRDATFRCDFVGTEPLAKGYGVARLYRLRRKARRVGGSVL